LAPRRFLLAGHSSPLDKDFGVKLAGVFEGDVDIDGLVLSNGASAGVYGK